MSAPGMPAGRLPVLQGMGARSNPLATGPNPVRADELRGPDDAAAAQRLHCADRPTCLATAARASWPAFTCGDCSAYVAMPVAQWRLEVIGLARFGLAIAKTSIAVPTIADLNLGRTP